MNDDATFVDRRVKISQVISKSARQRNWPPVHQRKSRVYFIVSPLCAHPTWHSFLLKTLAVHCSCHRAISISSFCSICFLFLESNQNCQLSATPSLAGCSHSHSYTRNQMLLPLPQTSSIDFDDLIVSF